MADMQELIDTLFAKLEAAETPGEVNQLTHALRTQLTRKRDSGQALSAREAAILGNLGAITQPSSGPSLVVVAVVVAVLAGLAFAAYRYIPG
jgi:hypothetical protein